MKKVAAGLLAAATLTGASLIAKNLVDPYETVLQVVDGDTFFLKSNHQTVRLFGLDAPELQNCYGLESMQRLDELLKKRKVQLREPLADHFGRIVALVYVDGKLINEILIREGFAAYRSEPGSGKELMKSAHEYAKANKIGIYSSACVDETPPNPKCNIKGNHDLDRDAYLYLLPSCLHYTLVNIRRFEGDRWFCTVKEAEAAGFSRSPACDRDIKPRP